MLAEIIILVVAFLLLVLSICLFCGKGTWLIAGYNTAPKEEREKYNKKKLCKAVGFLCLICSILLCIMAYLGYRVDTGAMQESVMLPFALLSIAVIVATLLITGRYIETKAKK